MPTSLTLAELQKLLPGAPPAPMDDEAIRRLARQYGLEQGLSPEEAAEKIFVEHGQTDPEVERKLRSAVEQHQGQSGLWNTARDYVREAGKEEAFRSDRLLVMREAISKIPPEQHAQFQQYIAEHAKEQARTGMRKTGTAFKRGARMIPESMEKTAGFITRKLSAAGLPIPGAPGPVAETSKKFLEEEAWLSQVEQARQAGDPIRGESWASRGLYGAAAMAPRALATAAASAGTGGVGAAVFGMTQIWPERFQEMVDSGVNVDTASSLSFVSAVPEALIETLQVKQLLPAHLRKGAQGVASRTMGQFLKRFTVEAGKGYVKEMGEEALQDAIGLTARAVATYLDENAPDLKFGDAVAEWTESMKQAAPAMLFLMGPGHVMGLASGSRQTQQNAQFAEKLKPMPVADRNAVLEAFGFDEQQRTDVLESLGLGEEPSARAPDAPVRAGEYPGAVVGGAREAAQPQAPAPSAPTLVDVSLSPESALDWAIAHPDQAEALAKIDSPSRGDFETAGIRTKLAKGERAEFARLLRDVWTEGPLPPTQAAPPAAEVAPEAAPEVAPEAPPVAPRDTEVDRQALMRDLGDMETTKLRELASRFGVRWKGLSRQGIMRRVYERLQKIEEPRFRRPPAEERAGEQPGAQIVPPGRARIGAPGAGEVRSAAPPVVASEERTPPQQPQSPKEPAETWNLKRGESVVAAERNEQREDLETGEPYTHTARYVVVRTGHNEYELRMQRLRDGGTVESETLLERGTTIEDALRGQERRDQWYADATKYGPAKRLWQEYTSKRDAKAKRDETEKTAKQRIIDWQKEAQAEYEAELARRKLKAKAKKGLAPKDVIDEIKKQVLAKWSPKIKAAQKEYERVAKLTPEDYIEKPKPEPKPAKKKAAPEPKPKAPDAKEIDYAESPRVSAPPSVKMEAKGEPVSAAGIVETMRQEWQIPIRRGRMALRKALGQYAPFDEIVRVQGKEAGNLAVHAHEVAHHIQRKWIPYSDVPVDVAKEVAKLDYDFPKKRRFKEGFAEFARHYLTEDDAATVSPLFNEWWGEWLGRHPDIKAKIDHEKALIDQWREQGATARVKSQIVSGGKGPQPYGVSLWSRIREALSNAAHRFYAANKDEGHYLNFYSQEAEKKGWKGENAYALWESLTQVGPTFADDAIEHGVFRVTGNMERVGPALREAFVGLDENRLADLTAFIYARHARDAWKRGINPGVSREDAEWAYKELYSDDFESRAQIITEFNNALIEMLVDAGAITPDAAARMMDVWGKSYIPLQRWTGEAERSGMGRKLVNLPPAVKRRFGSGLPVIDPIEATIARAVRFYERANQQQVLQVMLKAKRGTQGLGKWLERVKPLQKPARLSVGEVKDQLAELGLDAAELGDLAEEMLTVWRPDYYSRKAGENIVRIVTPEGKTELYEVHKDLYRAINGMNRLQLPWWLSWAGTLTRGVKLGATGLSVSFGIKNPVRDFVTFVMQSRYGGKAALRALPIPVPGTALFGYLATQCAHLYGKEGDPVVNLFTRIGGELSAVLGLDANRIRSKKEALFNNTTARRALAIAEHPVDALRTLISITEVAPRIAEFAATLEKEGWTRERIKKEGTPPRDVLVKAINAANDVTVNFRRMGYVGKWLNQLIPFYNAPLEAADKMVRTVRDQPVRTLLAGSMLAAATVAYWLTVKDEDWYKEQPDWMLGYYTIPGADGKPLIRIPKAQGWGMMISAGTEAMLNQLYEINPDAVAEWAVETAEQMLPSSFWPAAARPAVEVYTNKDFWKGKEIFPERQARKLLPKDQAFVWNTEFSKQAGKLVGCSPAKIDHLLDGYTGGLYSTVAKAAEKAAGYDDFGWRDIPGVKGLTFSRDYGRSVDEFYRTLDQVKKERGSAELKGDIPPEIERRYRRLNDVSDFMSGLRKTRKDVREREVRREADQYIVGLARWAMGKSELESLPNPLSSTEGMKPDVKAVRDEYLGRVLYRASDVEVTRRKRGESLEAYTERREARKRTLDEAREILAVAKLSPEQLYEVLIPAARRRGSNIAGTDFQRRRALLLSLLE